MSDEVYNKWKDIQISVDSGAPPRKLDEGISVHNFPVELLNDMGISQNDRNFLSRLQRVHDMSFNWIQWPTELLRIANTERLDGKVVLNFSTTQPIT
jgi:hypothetical protein